MNMKFQESRPVSEALLQQAHYDEIGEQYELHYSDTWSRWYREEFINAPLVEDLDLAGSNVLEAMCGSGTITQHLLARGANVTGLDVSPRMVGAFKQRWPQCHSIVAPITQTELADGSFDCVIVIGGLHHLHPYVEPAIDEIYRVLKPGGHFCFMEPDTASILDHLRRVWYRIDPFFEQNEAAIDLAALQAKNAGRFEFVRTRYGGNLAFFLVFNSMIFRIPARIKRYYSPALLKCEAFINSFQGKRWSCFVIGQWKKK